MKKLYTLRKRATNSFYCREKKNLKNGVNDGKLEIRVGKFYFILFYFFFFLIFFFFFTLLKVFFFFKKKKKKNHMLVRAISKIIPYANV